MSRSKGVCGLALRLAVAALLVAACMTIPAFAQFPTGTILEPSRTRRPASWLEQASRSATRKTGLTRTLPTGDDGAYRFFGAARWPL